jgi:protein-disulfide isomerase
MSKRVKKILYIILFLVIFFITLFSLNVFEQVKLIVNKPAEPVINQNRETVENKTDPYWGAIDAPIVIVEFSDFECPFCKQMYPILRELSIDYPTEVKFIYRDFLGHDNSQKSAEAAECANDQNKFLPYHDKLFTNQENLDLASLKKYARQVGISNLDEFDKCLDSGQYEKEVSADFADAIKLNIKGTPTFFINGTMVQGVKPKSFFVEVFNHILQR